MISSSMLITSVSSRIYWISDLKRLCFSGEYLQNSVMNDLVAVINGFVLFSTGMRITGFALCVPVNMVCVMMSCWEIDIENFSTWINHVR